MRSTIDRSSKTSGLGHNAPTEAVQPTPIVERVEESFCVCAVLCNDEHVNPSRAFKFLAGVGSREPGAGRSADDTAGIAERGQDGSECPPKAAEGFDLGRYRIRYAFRIVIEQNERWRRLAARQ
jgi:hypothetical protein